MVNTTIVKYPHNIIVIGKSTTIKGDSLKSLTQNAFQGWLSKNYVNDDNITNAMSNLHKSPERWGELKEKYNFSKSHQECLDMLELFAGQTIQVIAGM